MYHVYILKSRKASNWHYIGSTSDVENRLAKHNAGKVKSTRPYRPLEIVYKESFSTNMQARKREAFLKKTAKARVELFEKIENGAIV